jgi:pre-mRNA-splicing factor SYF1
MFMMKLKKGTHTRHVFDRALQSLPITQHDIIWRRYVNWARDYGVIETAVRIFRRFLMYDPTQREDFVEYLEQAEQFDEAAKQLIICLEDDNFVSGSGKTKHELWMRLCEICSTHPHEVSKVLKVESVIRSGIARFSDEVGRLWCRLADYYIRLGEFEKARDIFEEGIHVVITVRDFTVIFDAYVKFEESLLTAKMRMDEDEEEISFDLARIEYLIDKRPLLLNSVVLRQNPNNVHEWQKRVKLFKDDPKQTVLTYMEAVKSVDYGTCTGKLSGLWLGLAHYYEKHKDLENAGVVMKKATEANYKTVDELALVWCSWAELEIRHNNYNEALQIMLQAVREPGGSLMKKKSAAIEGGLKEDLSVHFRLHKNVKVWSLYLDLEESLGSVESCSCAYDKAMDLKVVTPQMALNYATYLEEHNFFENSFRVYERAISLFEWPHVKHIWLRYLDQFTARYGGSKLERLRDLFEQAVEKVPTELAAELFVRYAKAEEQFGLARHAMAVYDRATRAVPDGNRLDMYRLYIRKVEEFYGVTRTRPVYERATQELADDDCRELCLEFSGMERKLGEIDRARVSIRLMNLSLVGFYARTLL